MPELPDITIYLEALTERVLGQPLERVRLGNPFLVRSPEPPLASVDGRTVRSLGRIGKRIVFGLEGDLYLVLHLMIAGRLRWRERGARLANRNALAAFDFPNGTLVLTEAGSKRQASLYVVAGGEALASFDPGGMEVMHSDVTAFRERLLRERHTLKRALTDPHIFSGIGNAYSDEILHAAKLSPMKLTSSLTEDEIERLHDATIDTLHAWIDRLRDQTAGGFPEKVTAFHEEMAVHGRYGKPCPVCGSPIQRIVYASNEANYCATCQTEGRLLSDRALSRLLKDDWPKTLEDMERRKRMENGKG
jgi:formamidopyrimidine-DNA glycosylase